MQVGGHFSAGRWRSQTGIELARDVLLLVPDNMATKFVRLLVPAGGASPQPPVGQALGQAGINIMDFCKDFNAKTAHYIPGTPIPTHVTAYTKDRSFKYVTRTPQTSFFLKVCCCAGTLRSL